MPLPKIGGAMRNIYVLNEFEQEVYDTIPLLDKEDSYKNFEKYKNNISRYMYSKGGKEFFRGLYCPFNTLRLSKCTRLGKYVNAQCKYDFEYGFNKEKLIYIKTSWGTEEFIVEKNGEDLGVEFDYDAALTRITLIKYNRDNYPNLIISSNINKTTNWFNVDFTYEKVEYDNNLQMKTLEYIEKMGLYAPRYHSLREVVGDELLLLNEWVSN